MNMTLGPVQTHEALRALVKRLKNADTIFQLSASEKLTTATVHENKAEPIDVDPVYKGGVLIGGGQEFLFKDARLGKKEQIIFCFKPMDMQAYSWIELDEKKVFDTFPVAVDLFSEIPGFDFEDATDYALRFQAGRREYLRLWEADIELKKIEAEKEARRLKLEEQAPYADNPMVGMFG